MKLFIDTADVDQIREAAAWGILDGVTTNPTHVSKAGPACSWSVAVRRSRQYAFPSLCR